MDRREILVLPPAVSRRIAAGEVIERPASAVRELMENSVDAGSASVTVQIEGGGIDLIRVVDDGSGMSRQDMDVLATPHATSKIRREADLLGISSLGFRGEAMASLAAVADLEVVSSTDGLSAWRRASRPGREAAVEPATGRKGTIVEIRRLFESFPARKRFLKQPRTETLMVTQTFVDRALPHPALSFRLAVDGKPRLSLPPSSLKARVLSATEVEEPESFFFEARGGSGPISLDIILGGVEVQRPDRRHMQAFVNGRRVQDFSLLKALEIGYSGYLPGGIFPFAFAFISIDPSLVDFNIHPAKKEIRFREPQAVQAALIEAVRSAISTRSPARADFRSGFPSPSGRAELQDRAPVLPFPPPSSQAAYSWKPETDPRDFLSWPSVAEHPAGPAEGASLNPKPRIVAQVLGTFILVESGDALVFIDQHAAHERMIFDRLQGEKPALQNALLPISFEAEGEEESLFLRDSGADLAAAGFLFSERGGLAWELKAWPAGLSEGGLDIVRDILSLRGKGDLLRGLRALTACRSAVKDGDRLDPAAMEEIASFALNTAEPRCPHGRPLAWTLKRDELFRAVGRIVH